MVEAKVGRVFMHEESLGHTRAHGLKVMQAELQIRNPINMAYMVEGSADVALIDVRFTTQAVGRYSHMNTLPSATHSDSALSDALSKDALLVYELSRDVLPHTRHNLARERSQYVDNKGGMSNMQLTAGRTGSLSYLLWFEGAVMMHADVMALYI